SCHRSSRRGALTASPKEKGAFPPPKRDPSCRSALAVGESFRLEARARGNRSGDVLAGNGLVQGLDLVVGRLLDRRTDQEGADTDAGDRGRNVAHVASRQLGQTLLEAVASRHACAPRRGDVGRDDQGAENQPDVEKDALAGAG